MTKYVEKLLKIRDSGIYEDMCQILKNHEDMFCFPDSICIEFAFAYPDHWQSEKCLEAIGGDSEVANSCLRMVYDSFAETEFPKIKEGLQEELEELKNWHMSDSFREECEESLEYWIDKFSSPRGDRWILGWGDHEVRHRGGINVQEG